MPPFANESRRQFLTGVLRSGLLLTSMPAPGVIEGVDDAGPRRDDPRAQMTPVPVFAAFLRGVQYRHLSPAFVEGLQAGDPVDLVREPYNAYDRQAIAAYADGVHVGYLPREDNVVLSRLLDAGLPLACRFAVVDPLREPWHRLAVELELLYPTQCLRPNRPDDAGDDEPGAPPSVGSHPDAAVNSTVAAGASEAGQSRRSRLRSPGYVPRPDELTDDVELQRALATAARVGVLPGRRGNGR